MYNGCSIRFVFVQIYFYCSGNFRNVDSILCCNLNECICLHYVGRPLKIMIYTSVFWELHRYPAFILLRCGFRRLWLSPLFVIFEFQIRIGFWDHQKKFWSGEMHPGSCLEIVPYIVIHALVSHMEIMLLPCNKR